MIFKNNDILGKWLRDKGYSSLADLPELEVDESQFNANLDEVRNQHPAQDDLESQSRAVYRILTHANHTNETAISKEESPTAGTALKAMDDLARTFRQQIGVLAGKTSVVEAASKAMTEGISVHKEAIEHCETVALGVGTSVEKGNKQLEFITALIHENELNSQKRHGKLIKIIIAICIAVGLLLAASIAKAEPEPTNAVEASNFIHALTIMPPHIFPQMQSTYARMQFVSGGIFVNVSSSAPLPITCITGCSGGGGGGGTSSNFGATFPTAGTAAGASDGTSMQPLLVDGSGFLKVNVSAGGGSGGTSSSFGSAFPATGTASGFIGSTGNMAGANLDASGNLKTVFSNTTIAATQSGTWNIGTLTSITNPVAVTGTFFQATQPVSCASAATCPSAVTQTTSPWIVAGGGTAGSPGTAALTVQGIGSGTPMPVSLASAPTTHVIVDSGNLTSNQNVAVAAALPAGTNVIGHVIADSGSTTAVTGNVTVVQSTGTNLHAVLDTTSTTAVTQGTAANLNATVVGTGTFAAQVTGTVTANSGTNLNTSLLQLDATGAKLNLAQASTTSGQTGPLVQCAVTTAAPSYSTTQTDPLSCDTAGNVRVTGSVTIPSNQSVNLAQVNGVTTSTGAGATGTGTQRVGVAQDATTIAGSAPGTAGSASTNVVSVQGIASGTALAVSCTAATCPMNEAQINGVVPLMGNGVTGTGSQRVTIASDNTAFAVNATLSAETTKVIGTVNQGTSPWVSSCTAANCAINVAQVNGVTTSTGTGAVGTGTARVAVGTDTATIAGTAPLANNATAAGTTAIAILEGIAQTSYANGTAYTAGRAVSPDVFTDGALHVAALPAMRPASYHASASFAGSSTTVNAHLAGNATNTVLVTKITMSCTQTTAGNLTVTVNKTSAASSGGTAATMTAIPDDSTYAAASSVAQSFTGTGPTAGTPVGQIDAYKLGCMATTTATPNDIYILNLRQKPIVLRGTAQTLEIGLGGAVTGGNVTMTWEWMEVTTITP